MIQIFENSAQSIDDGGKIRYYYYLNIYGQNPLARYIRKLFGLKPLYKVKLEHERLDESRSSFKFQLAFRLVLCNSYVEGKEALMSQVESLRGVAAKGPTCDDTQCIKPLIDSSVDYVNLLTA